MGESDDYQFGRTQPLGKVTFGDEQYSDKFERSTQDLGDKKRRTSPLNATSELKDQGLARAEDQLRVCRIIVDKFSSRIKILRWAEDLVQQLGPQQTLALKVAPPHHESKPTPTKPAKGGLGLGLKKPLLGKKPLLSPKGKPGQKADTAAGAPESGPNLGFRASVVLSGPEQTLAMAVSKWMAAYPQIRRHVQVALVQYAEAKIALEAGESTLAQLRGLGPRQALDELEQIGINKIQGKIYPIVNFHAAFRQDGEALAAMFPTPQPQRPTKPESQTQAQAQAQAQAQTQLESQTPPQQPQAQAQARSRPPASSQPKRLG